MEAQDNHTPISLGPRPDLRLGNERFVFPDSMVEREGLEPGKGLNQIPRNQINRLLKLLQFTLARLP